MKNSKHNGAARAAKNKRSKRAAPGPVINIFTGQPGIYRPRGRHRNHRVDLLLELAEAEAYFNCPRRGGFEAIPIEVSKLMLHCFYVLAGLDDNRKLHYDGFAHVVKRRKLEGRAPLKAKACLTEAELNYCKLEAIDPEDFLLKKGTSL
jgi:hypothetical protein